MNSHSLYSTSETCDYPFTIVRPKRSRIGKGLTPSVESAQSVSAAETARRLLCLHIVAEQNIGMAEIQLAIRDNGMRPRGA